MPQLTCPACQKKLNVPDEALGRKVKCPSCQGVFAAMAPQAAVVAPTAVVEEPEEEEEEQEAQPTAKGKKKKTTKKAQRPVSLLTAVGVPVAVGVAIFLLAFLSCALNGFAYPVGLVFAPIVAGWGTFLLMAGICRWEWLAKPQMVLLSVLLVGFRYDPISCMIRGILLGILAVGIALLPWFGSPPKDQQDGKRRPDTSQFEPKNFERLAPNEFLAKYLPGLSSADPLTRANAINQMANASPQTVAQLADRRNEVLEKLQPLMTDKDFSTARGAIQAYGRWATQEQALAVLIPAFKKETDLSKSYAMLEALTTTHRSPEVIRALVQLLAENPQWSTCKQFLIKFGPPAEAEVLPLLDNPNPAVQQHGCDILFEVGTRRSLPKLEKIAKDSQHPARGTAQRAVDSISLWEPQ
jgi:hypothetical protein